MAAFILPESAENALYLAERLAALMESTFAQLGDAQVEVQGSELSATFGLIRGQIAQAKDAARFDARAG